MSDQAPAAPEFIPKLQELTKGLYFMSESDYPVEVVCFKPEGNTPITETQILKWAGQPETACVKTDNLPHFFRNMVKEAMVGAETAEQFKNLQLFLEQNLQDIKVYLIEEREVQALVLGKAANGDYVGVKTIVVQT